MAKAVGTRELAEHVSKKAGITPKQARVAIKSTFEGIAINLKRADKVNITGLGSFSKRIRPAQKGGQRKVVFGQEVVTKPKPATTKVKFRPSGGFKDLLGTRK